MKKRAIKMANRAKYESWRDAGENSKTKRHRKGRRLANTVSHPEGPCGNIGCKKCDSYRVHMAA